MSDRRSINNTPPSARAANGATRTVGRSGLTSAVRTYLATEAGGAVILVAAAVLALLWVNSPLSASYEDFWTIQLGIDVGSARLALDLRDWVNDGLMAFFFFVVGLEIRRELDMGELRERRRVAVPVIAAVGGMALPALLFVLINAGGDGVHGWGMVMATDTALALGVLALAGRRAPSRLRTFLLTLVIVDDVVAISIIAIFYASDLNSLALAVAIGLFGVVLAMRAVGIRQPGPYILIVIPIWLATLEAGIHPTIAGVVMGLLTGAYVPPRAELERASAEALAFREQPTPETARVARRSIQAALAPNERLQYALHPWTSFVIVPIFALANAGIDLRGDVLSRSLTSPIAIGVVVGLVLGKPAGIVGASWLASRRRLGGLPLSVGWPQLIAAGSVAGIGFTVSLLIAELAYEGDQLTQAKVGILAASLLAAGLSSLLFRAVELIPATLRARLSGTTADPLLDLDPSILPEWDHVRGPVDAPVVLVEYGDYECPYCGMAEPVVRELLEDFGDGLAYVFRHYPLTDVHPHAAQAAEAAEAAAAQGSFWEMHDLLFANQAALEPADLHHYAAALGLDVERFTDGLREGHYARRVAEDAESGDRSGVAGTPTFFINGRRHYGAYDLATLSSAVRAARVDGSPSLTPATLSIET
jgi:Na+/H+ antiporter NhaA